MEQLKAAVEEENLGRVKSMLNANPGLVTEMYFHHDGEPYTILKRAKEVASWYSSPESFAHKIVAELVKRGATMPPEVQIPEGLSAEEIYNNLYGAETPPAAAPVVVTPPPSRPRRPGLPPLHPVSQTHRNLSQGIAARPKSSRKRKTKRRKSTRRTRRSA